MLLSQRGGVYSVFTGIPCNSFLYSPRETTGRVQRYNSSYDRQDELTRATFVSLVLCEASLSLQAPGIIVALP